jgi:hypothetical protein
MAAETETKPEDKEKETTGTEEGKESKALDPKPDEDKADKPAGLTADDVKRQVAEALAEKEKSDKEAAETKKLEDNKEFDKLLAKERDRVKELEKKYNDLLLERVKERAARKHGLPDAMAVRLVGTTEAEINEDAKQLKKSLPADAGNETPTDKEALGTPGGGAGAGNKKPDTAKVDAYRGQFSI